MNIFVDTKGIIFDMDNTILQSKINFGAMRAEIYDFLIKHELIPSDIILLNNTTSTLVEAAKHSSLYNDKLDETIWNIATKHELEGMKNAVLEPGIANVLEYLYKKYHLVVLTNNSYKAAVSALKDNNVEGYFDKIIGREQVPALKPSPAGVNFIINLYNETKAKNWLSIGDSWLDARASQDAGVAFISYRGNLTAMKNNGVKPVIELNHMKELINILDSSL